MLAWKGLTLVCGEAKINRVMKYFVNESFKLVPLLSAQATWSL
jgi:hypothetical protein